MKILSLLTQSKKDVTKSKAERKAKALSRKQESLIDTLEDRRDDLQARKETLLTLTVDSNIDTWNQDYQDIQVELHLITKQIEIAKETSEDLFS